MHHELPGTRQHECRDDEGRNDVRVLPPGRHNDATSDEDGDGAQHVRQHVEERPLDVHRVLPLTVQNPCRYRVRDQTDQRNDHHRASENLDGLTEPADRLHHDPHGDAQHGHRVDERGHHFHAPVAKSRLRV